MAYIEFKPTLKKVNLKPDGKKRNCVRSNGFIVKR